MKKVKCEKCGGKGKIKYKREGFIKPLVGLCSSCWGQGFRMVKTEKELHKEFLDDQERCNAQGLL